MAESTDTFTHTVKRVVDDVRELFREEVALARAEIRHEVGEFTRAGVQMAAGALAGLLAIMFLLHAVALGLAEAANWSPWLAYGVVAVVVGIIAAVALMTGARKARRTPAVPQQTIETLQENKEWLKNRMSSEHR